MPKCYVLHRLMINSLLYLWAWQPDWAHIAKDTIEKNPCVKHLTTQPNAGKHVLSLKTNNKKDPFTEIVCRNLCLVCSFFFHIKKCHMFSKLTHVKLQNSLINSQDLLNGSLFMRTCVYTHPHHNSEKNRRPSCMSVFHFI